MLVMPKKLETHYACYPTKLGTYFLGIDVICGKYLLFILWISMLEGTVTYLCDVPIGCFVADQHVVMYVTTMLGTTSEFTPCYSNNHYIK